eukprot:Hpha_TRINITY_DN15463_c1_g3::TRINITY_DN15463_c1_g3_i1::g.175392::m.175392
MHRRVASFRRLADASRCSPDARVFADGDSLRYGCHARIDGTAVWVAVTDNRLRVLAQEHGAPLFTVNLSEVDGLLEAVSRPEDLVVVVPCEKDVVLTMDSGLGGSRELLAAHIVTAHAELGAALLLLYEVEGAAEKYVRRFPSDPPVIIPLPRTALDFLNLSQNASVKTKLRQHGDRSVQFTDRVFEAKRFEPPATKATKVVIVSDHAVYLTDRQGKVELRTPIQNITSASGFEQDPALFVYVDDRGNEIAIRSKYTRELICHLRSLRVDLPVRWDKAPPARYPTASGAVPELPPRPASSGSPLGTLASPPPPAVLPAAAPPLSSIRQRSPPAPLPPPPSRSPPARSEEREARDLRTSVSPQDEEEAARVAAEVGLMLHRAGTLSSPTPSPHRGVYLAHNPLPLQVSPACAAETPAEASGGAEDLGFALGVCPQPPLHEEGRGQEEYGDGLHAEAHMKRRTLPQELQALQQQQQPHQQTQQQQQPPPPLQPPQPQQASSVGEYPQEADHSKPPSHAPRTLSPVGGIPSTDLPVSSPSLSDRARHVDEGLRPLGLSFTSAPPSSPQAQRGTDDDQPLRALVSLRDAEIAELRAKCEQLSSAATRRDPTPSPTIPQFSKGRGGGFGGGGARVRHFRNGRRSFGATG